MVFEQIDLVDVQEASVSPSQKPRLECFHALGESPFEVERTDHPVLGGAERQIDDRHRRFLVLQRAACGAGLALGAVARRGSGIAIVAAACHDAHGWQKSRKRAHGRGLAAPPIAENQDAADARVDCRGQNRKLHIVLADDRRKRKGGRHAQAILARGRPADTPAEAGPAWAGE